MKWINTAESLAKAANKLPQGSKARDALERRLNLVLKKIEQEKPMNTVSENGTISSGLSDRVQQSREQAAKEKDDRYSDTYRNNLKNDYLKR